VLYIDGSLAMSCVSDGHMTNSIAADYRRGHHEHLLIYSFKIKSLFDARSLLLMPVCFLAICCVLWLNDTSYSKK